MTTEELHLTRLPAPDVPVAPVAPGPRLAVIMGAMIALAPLTIDTYLPALPAIEQDLSASAAAVQLTLTGTMVGLAVGQVVIGPLSDALGRRRPLLAGAAIHVLASLLIAVAPTIAVLGVLRVLQGFGAAAAAVVTTAMVRDVATGRVAATLMSRLLLVMGVAPVLAPTLGSQVLQLTAWRGIFVVLAGLGVALFVIGLLFVPETLPAHRRRRGAGPAGIVRGYAVLLRDVRFVGLVLVTGLAMAALFGYVAGSSFVLQGAYGLSEQQFAVVFAGGAVALIGAAQVNPWLLGRFEPQVVLAGALVGGTVAGGVLLLAAATGLGGLPGLLGATWAALAAGGLALPNAPALALSRFGDDVAGSAAAVVGAAQFGLAALAPPLVGVLGVDAVAMAAVMLGCTGLALVALLALVRPWSFGQVAPLR